MLAVAVNKADPLGERRRQASDRGKALAGRCTLNRLELTGAEVDEQERYKKIAMDPDRIDGWMVDAFVESHESAPEEIVLDLDATDDPIHGQQEGRFFHGYYRHYCYLPLYIFSGEHLLCARLRCSNIDGAAGSVEELERIVGRIRQSWPEVSIVIRADSGFSVWCKDHPELVGPSRSSFSCVEANPTKPARTSLSPPPCRPVFKRLLLCAGRHGEPHKSQQLDLLPTGPARQAVSVLRRLHAPCVVLKQTPLARAQ